MTRAKAMDVECPHCHQSAQLVGGDAIYPHHPDLAGKLFYSCAPCGAYVGCHARPTRTGHAAPLGTPADTSTRNARKSAHAAFDPLWREGGMTRNEAYAWLSDKLGTSKGETHIAMFTASQCFATVAAVAAIGAP